MTDFFRRFRAIDTTPDDKGQITLVASSDEPVDMRGWSEVLTHADGNIDLDTARALLINHDPNQIAGRITAVTISGGRSVMSAEIDKDARLSSGVSVARAVESGALKGVSIGYTYSDSDAVFDEKTRTVTVKKWRLLEASLTPIPRDKTAHVRSLPSCFAAAPTAKGKIVNDPVKIARQAESLGLRASDYLDKDNAAELMLADVAKTRAQPVPTTQTRVVTDEFDKIRDQAVDSLTRDILASPFDDKSDKRSANAVSVSVFDIVRRFLKRTGVDSSEWSRADFVDYVFRSFSTHEGKRAAETSANFNQVTALATNKLVVAGFEGYSPWSEPLVSRMQTNDFKTVRTAGLAIGDFNTPSEGSAFADLTIDDATGGTGVLTMGGGGLELTKQALYNDELGLFLNKLRKVGWMGARHQDKKFVAALEAASFSSASTTGALSAATLKTGWTAFTSITDPVGEKTGYTPQFLLVPNETYITALELTTLAQGATTESPLASNSVARSINENKLPLQVVRGKHLTNATAWYLLADPNEASLATVVTHNDYPVPQVFEVDSGLVASRKFRVEYPLLVIINMIAANKPIGGLKSNGT